MNKYTIGVTDAAGKVILSRKILTYSIPDLQLNINFRAAERRRNPAVRLMDHDEWSEWEDLIEFIQEEILDHERQQGFPHYTLLLWS
tara:strand:- start:349 stop:609 length:261 start_codon:yes stop_codon:yes gene_type:complete